MLPGFAGFTAIGVSFCEVWARLTSTTGEIEILPAPAVAAVASVAAAASAAMSARVIRVTLFSPLGSTCGPGRRLARRWIRVRVGDPQLLLELPHLTVRQQRR